MSDSKTNKDNIPCHVGRFDVMHQTGEYDWEMVCGPYKTYEAAEKDRQDYYKKDEIPHMRVVQFFSASDKTNVPDVGCTGLLALKRNVSAILQEALSGMDAWGDYSTLYRSDDGYVQWGMVEDAIHNAIDRIMI